MNLGFAFSLVSEWELAGVSDAVISPGSRSTPLAIALAESNKIDQHVILDERSAGFFALGLSKVTLKPTIVLTTSGTAAANLRPSVTEAFHMGIPLIVVTSDRPLELHQFGAAQTMEQEELFSDVVVFRYSPSIPDGENRSRWRAIGSRVYHEAYSNSPKKGPVHLNLAFREPLTESNPQTLESRRPNIPWYRVHNKIKCTLGDDISDASRVLVVAGGRDAKATDLVVSNCIKAKVPIIADPMSSFRNVTSNVLGSFEAFLRSDTLVQQILPDLVFLVGDDLSSRTLNEFIKLVSDSGALVIRVSPRWFFRDPFNSVTDFYFGSIDEFFELIDRKEFSQDYFTKLISMDRAARAGIEEYLGDRLSEPVIASKVYAAAGSDDLVFSSSSMPIRDFEWFAPVLGESAEFYSNRGVNGIDGVVSTFLGATKAHQSQKQNSRSFLLIGDLALRHDIGILATLASCGLNIFICVVDNDGGGIFSFLSQASSLDETLFEELFGTPQNGDLSAILTGFGLRTRIVDEAQILDDELKDFQGSGGIRVAVIRTDRRDNVVVHQRALAAGMEQATRAWDTVN